MSIRFIPKEKLSKKAQRELNAARRTLWAVSPVSKKVESKKHFKDAVDLIGVGSKLISALSGLTTVLKFFGISPV